MIHPDATKTYTHQEIQNSSRGPCVNSTRLLPETLFCSVPWTVDVFHKVRRLRRRKRSHSVRSRCAESPQCRTAERVASATDRHFESVYFYVVDQVLHSSLTKTKNLILVNNSCRCRHYGVLQLTVAVPCRMARRV